MPDDLGSTPKQALKTKHKTHPKNGVAGKSEQVACGSAQLETLDTDWAETSLTRLRDARAEQAFSWLNDWPAVAETASDQGQKK